MRRRQFLAVSAGAALSLTGRAEAQNALGLGVGLQALVTADGVHLRGGPGPDQPVVGVLNAGMQVDVLGASSDSTWWRVASDGGVGHVSGAFLEATGTPNTSGVLDIDLAIPYARQLTSIWCDPADLEMWMRYRQGGSTNGGTSALQSAIWDWETTHNAGFSVDQWDCSPYAVASAAANWMNDASFDHFTYDDPLAGSRVLAWLIANRQMREPSIALIWNGLHYVLVRGVRAIGDPATDPGGTTLLGFYVADPDPGASLFLGSDRFIPMQRWVGELFTPVSYLTPHTGMPGDRWQDAMVAIQRTWTPDGPSQAGQRNATIANYA